MDFFECHCRCPEVTALYGVLVLVDHLFTPIQTWSINLYAVFSQRDNPHRR